MRPVILLDEATAALDSDPKSRCRAIEHLCQNRTTIVIAIACTHHARRRHHGVEGASVERGHDDLLRRNGRYASFFRLQHRDAGALTWRRSAQPLKLPPISALTRRDPS